MKAILLPWIITFLEVSASAHHADTESSSHIVYARQLFRIPAEFWSEGVDTSRGILETILRKVNTAGSQLDYLLKEHSDLIIKNSFQAIQTGEIWLDKDDTPRMSLSIDHGSFCAVVDNLKYPLPELSYTCEEAEQLYGVGYHKVYESCKDEEFFERITVDWTTCMHAHYPWIDIFETSICIVKSYVNDFLACFCSVENGTIIKRGFCLTKLECALSSKKATDEPVKLVIFSSECFEQVHYFIEAKTMDVVDFENAQRQENLRVRPPYHQESVCYNEEFTSLFDIGQLDVDNIDSGILVHTPLKPEPTEESNRTVTAIEHLAKLGALKIILVKRIMLNVCSLFNGFILILMNNCLDPSKNKIFVRKILQMFILSSGVMNFLLSIVPEHLEWQCLVLVPILIQLFFNNEESTNFSLHITMIDIVVEMVIWMSMSHGIFDNYLSTYAYFFVLVTYILYTTILYKEQEYPEHLKSDANLTTESKTKKKNHNVVTKKDEKKVTTPQIPKKKKEPNKKSKATNSTSDAAKINCHANCVNISTRETIIVNCANTCYIEFHDVCWKKFSTTSEVNLKICPNENCFEEISEIVTVNVSGKEIKKRTIKKETKETNSRNQSKVKNFTSMSKTIDTDNGKSSNAIQSKLNDPDKPLKKQIWNINKRMDNPSLQDHIKHLSDRASERTSNEGSPATANKDAEKRGRNFSKDFHQLSSNKKNQEEKGSSNIVRIKTSSSPRTMTQHSTNADLGIPVDDDNHLKSTDSSDTRLVSNQRESNFLYKSKVNSNENADKKSCVLMSNSDKKENTQSTESLVYVPGEQKQTNSTIAEQKSKHRRDGNMLKKSCSPLTKILHKEMAGYSLNEIDKAVSDILNSSESSSANLTIPEFKDILMKKLDNELWPDGIYISDDEE